MATLVCTAAGPASAQELGPAATGVTGTQTARVETPPDDDPAPISESGEDDPLAPKDADKPAPLAPGAAPAGTAPSPVPPAGAAPGGPASDTAAATTTPADPVIEAARTLIAKLPLPGKGGDRDDHEVAVAHYAALAKPHWVDATGLNARGRAVVEEIGRAADWGLEPTAFDLPALAADAGSPPPGADVLAQAEVATTLAVLKYARHARGGRFDPLSISRKFDQKPAVFEPGSVLIGLAVSDDPAAYLRGLHPRHPQFERLRQAMLAARGPDKPPASVEQIRANMERWRWMPPELGSFYVWDNVPEQMTYVVRDGTVIHSAKIVVGKLSTPTPVFSAGMQFIIFQPSWGVPPGMKANELGPQLRNTGGGWWSSKPLASTVLRSHGLTVTRGGVPVDPDSIDWSTANVGSYDFTQPAGPKNVLGVVKFRFPNKHNVYMHDTQERHLFGGKVRAFSHGCMRVENPVRLAEVLLAHAKGWTADEVKAALRRGATVELETPIPVHVAYFTVEVADDGKVLVHPDLYGLDSRVASALAGRPVRIAAQAVTETAVGETGAGPVAGQRKPSARERREQRRAERERAAARVEVPGAINPFGF
ncbi:MAG: L,D-transpeptidase family protein [Hyphomicrobiaceae bacterium]|nr:L,D-transpeptidase family protein [Hyphomicrobiaceae bacterium]